MEQLEKRICEKSATERFLCGAARLHQNTTAELQAAPKEEGAAFLYLWEENWSGRSIRKVYVKENCLCLN